MRERDALKMAKKFVASKYPELSDCYIEVALEGDGGRRRSWSFGVHIDEEDSRYDPAGSNNYVGYVFHEADTGRPVVSGVY